MICELCRARVRHGVDGPPAVGRAPSSRSGRAIQASGMWRSHRSQDMLLTLGLSSSQAPVTHCSVPLCEQWARARSPARAGSPVLYAMGPHTVAAIRAEPCTKHRTKSLQLCRQPPSEGTYAAGGRKDRSDEYVRRQQQRQRMHSEQRDAWDIHYYICHSDKHIKASP